MPRLRPETPKGGITAKADLRTRFDELVAAMDTELKMVRPFGAPTLTLTLQLADNSKRCLNHVADWRAPAQTGAFDPTQDGSFGDLDAIAKLLDQLGSQVQTGRTRLAQQQTEVNELKSALLKCPCSLVMAIF